MFLFKTFRINLPDRDELFQNLKSYAAITGGALVISLGFSLFQIPYDLAAGGITGASIIIRVFCTVNRAQIFELKQVVEEVTPDAFMVIGNAHQATGIGYRPVRKKHREKR